MADQQAELQTALISLGALQKGNKTKRVLAIYREICTAKQLGASNRQVLELLNSFGFELSLKTFESILHRIKVSHQRDGRVINNIPGKFLQAGKSVGFDKPDKLMRPATPSDLKRVRNQVVDLNLYDD